MTKEEAIKYGIEWLKDEYLDAKDRAFIKIALEALEQEPKTLIEKLEKYKVSPDYIYDYFAYNKAINDVVCIIKEYFEDDPQESEG